MTAATYTVGGADPSRLQHLITTGEVAVTPISAGMGHAFPRFEKTGEPDGQRRQRQPREHPSGTLHVSNYRFLSSPDLAASQRLNDA